MIALAAIGLLAHGWLGEVSRIATGGLVAAIWQGILLATAAGLGLRLLPKTPAAVRFAIWFAVFLVVTALPVVSLLPHEAGVGQAAGHAPWLTLDPRWSLAIVALWAVASLVRAVTLAVAAFRVRALWKRATPVLTAVPGIATGTRRAQLCTSDEIDRPTVIGFFSPKILIPGWLLEKLTPAELEHVILHESGHLGRADDWMNLLQKIALVIFPLNPALAWVERRLCFERELAVDERVLHAFAGKAGAAKAYATCLARLAEYRLGRRGLALALGALGRESELGRRVGRILRRGELMKPRHAGLVLSGAMLALLGSAVALERCPQVVGFAQPIAFAPAANQNAKVVAPAGIGSTSSTARYRYQAVVFHANQTPGQHWNPSQQAHRVVITRVKAVPRDRTYTATRAIAIVARQDEDEEASGPTAPPARIRVVQWVTMTSWVGPDGSRLILTSASSPTATGVASDVTAIVPASGDAAAAQQQTSPQIHPYAAVPVRGGWLVFQL